MPMMLELADGIYSADVGAGMVREDLAALLAANFPVKPPAGWFADPQLGQLTPLTIDSDGHVYGHIASWRQSHIGLAGGVRAPKSRSGYGFFATGVLECDDGSHANVGQITLAGGHAPLEASVAEAVAHYDNTSSAWCDVSAGEDRHGVWVNGSMRPDVDELRLRSIRASSVSGDWRPINGALELVAVCAVNVPGFPIPRARVASGQVVALVAAGTEALTDVARGADTPEMMVGFERRLFLLEEALLDRARDNRQAIDGEVDVLIEGDPDVVDGIEPIDAPAPEDDEAAMIAAAATDQRWSDGMGIHLSVPDITQAQLRIRVRPPSGTLVATATSTWNADTRKKAASSGVALPDGSFPIRDKRDWEKARHALGRAKDKPRAIRHIKKRGRTLGIAKEKVDAVGAS